MKTTKRPVLYEVPKFRIRCISGHKCLIHGRRITTLPDLQGDDDEEEVGITRRYRYLSKRLQHFWRRWRREYLTGLRKSHDWKATGVEKVPKVGDVVTVFEDGVKRNNWKMAVVESLILGKEEQVRGANVRVITKGKIVRLSRPVQKLYPIEVSAELPEITGARARAERVTEARTRNVPRRTAALDVAWRTREMLNQSNE